MPQDAARVVLVIPEVGAGGLFLELLRTYPLAIYVKGTPLSCLAFPLSPPTRSGNRSTLLSPHSLRFCTYFRRLHRVSDSVARRAARRCPAPVPGAARPGLARVRPQDPQQFLYFLPLPQGQGAFLPTFWERTAAAFFTSPSLPPSSTMRRAGFSSAFTSLTWNM